MNQMKRSKIVAFLLAFVLVINTLFVNFSGAVFADDDSMTITNLVVEYYDKQRGRTSR